MKYIENLKKLFQVSIDNIRKLIIFKEDVLHS